MKYGIPSAMLVLAALISLPATGSGQTIIENAAGPAAKNAGRVLTVEEVWRITDDSGEFFFKMPTGFQIAGDGSIFLTDQGQILHFSADGTFIKNVLRSGEGPGEIRGNRAHPPILVRGSDLYVYDNRTSRCWRADLDGKYQEEFPVPRARWTTPVGVLREGLLFWRLDWEGFGSPANRDPAATGRYVDAPHALTLVTWAPGTTKDLFTVTNKLFVSPRMAQPEHLISTLSPDGRRLYFVQGSEYLVQELDLTSGAVVRRFRRPYQRVPTQPDKPVEGPYAKEIEEYQAKGWFPPKPQFVLDVQDLRVVGDQIWVMTSTRDKEKGSLIDVFDLEGRYVDCFYTGKTWGMAFDGFLLGSRTREDDTVIVVKYRIVK